METSGLSPFHLRGEGGPYISYEKENDKLTESGGNPTLPEEFVFVIDSSCWTLLSCFGLYTARFLIIILEFM